MNSLNESEILENFSSLIPAGNDSFGQYQIKYLRPVVPSYQQFGKAITNIKKVFPEYNLNNLYLFNSTGLRCDEFTKTHNGLHVLFAGCSVTSGEGLFLEDSWSYKVYAEISKNKKTSGYFNIAFPGASYMDILNQIFVYVSIYGMPDIIFINFPEIQREYPYMSTKSLFTKIDQTTMDDPKTILNTDRINLLIYNYYQALVQICKKTNSKLYSFSWDSMPHGKTFFFNFDPREHFDNFYRIDFDKMQNYLFEFEQNNKNHQLKDFFLFGFDEEHPGIAMHDFYYKFIYEIYQKDLKS